MKRELKCPHCQADIDLRALPHQGWFESYRVCPNCAQRFDTDRRTKQRQLLCLIVAVFSLAFTMLLYFRGSVWLLAACTTYVLLGALIYRGNAQMKLVPYRSRQTSG